VREQSTAAAFELGAELFRAKRSWFVTITIFSKGWNNALLLEDALRFVGLKQD